MKQISQKVDSSLLMVIYFHSFDAVFVFLRGHQVGVVLSMTFGATVFIGPAKACHFCLLTVVRANGCIEDVLFRLHDSHFRTLCIAKRFQYFKLYRCIAAC